MMDDGMQIDDDGNAYWTCPKCGGEGFVELHDCPELWGQDSPPANDIAQCPECIGMGRVYEGDLMP